MRLAQRRGLRVRIGGLDAPAGKADLSGVVAQLRGALREQHA